MTNEKREHCVYMHTCQINNKKYIGRSVNPIKRWGNKGSGYLKKNKNDEYVQPLFARAIEKYGWDSFTHEILFNDLTASEANEKEKELIKLYDTNNPKKGYNIQKGGSMPKDFEYCRQKQRERMLGENNPMRNHICTPEERWAKGKGRRGKSFTQEEKERQSKALKKYYQEHEHHSVGTTRTEEYKQHMREVMKGRTFSDEHKENIGKAHAPFTYKCVETNKEYYSSGEAMRDTGIDKASIRRCADGQQKVAGGLHWIKIPKENS